jgi:predicted RNase H-like HicB family nuclease
VTHKYEIIIHWSTEDQVYVAEVPELPGCMAHGDTHESALANANEAIQLWIDTAQEFGDPIPKDGKFPLRGSPVTFIDPTSPVAWSDPKADE